LGLFGGRAKKTGRTDLGGGWVFAGNWGDLGWGKKNELNAKKNVATPTWEEREGGENPLKRGKKSYTPASG